MAVYPTKANLMATRRSLELAQLGYELLDRKRNILMREMVSRNEGLGALRQEMRDAFAEAYRALALADLSLGQKEISQLASAVPPVDDFHIRYRSVMGVEVPEIKTDDAEPPMPYGISSSTRQLDRALAAFRRARQLALRVAAAENGVLRLSEAVKQSKKRANALKNIVIPRLAETERIITAYLEEKERESFTTLKVLKSRTD